MEYLKEAPVTSHYYFDKMFLLDVHKGHWFGTLKTSSYLSLAVHFPCLLVLLCNARQVNYQVRCFLHPTWKY